MPSSFLAALKGGRHLAADGSLCESPLHLDGPCIVADPSRPGKWLDTTGCVVLPGIVDFHGDAFERQIMPRPNVSFPLDVALLDTDRQLAANGITTALHGVTYSWEGGLRGREMAFALLEQLQKLQARFAVDHRVHLRFECHNLAGEADAMQWLKAGRIALLAFNEHLPGIRRKLTSPAKLQEYADRAGATPEAFVQRLEAAAARSSEVPALVARLAAQARALGVPMASHDDDSIAMREHFAELGCDVSEFPLRREVAEHAVRNGAQVVCGSPNILRGGSHVGAPRAIDLVRDRLCGILASDYYYPAPLNAAFQIVNEGVASLAEVWPLVSRNPARALRLDDRGALRPGFRADIIVVEAPTGGRPRLVATICSGRLAHLADGARLHESR